MKGINRRLRPLAIKQQQILQRLLPSPEDVDDVLRERAADERRDGANLAAEVLEEGAQEFGGEGGDVEVEFVVLVAGEFGEEFEVGAGVWVGEVVVVGVAGGGG